jgi:hypothetical protein
VQQDERVRRVDVLVPHDENDALAKTQVSAFKQALADFRWSDSSNVRMDLRWGGADANRIRALAQDGRPENLYVSHIRSCSHDDSTPKFLQVVAVVAISPAFPRIAV